MKDTNKTKREIGLDELISALSESADPLMYQYFKGLSNHKLIINGGIDSTTIELYVLPLLEWDKDDSVEKIHIILNTTGGNIFDGMTLAETISNLKTKTTVEILSYAYSMGGYIAVAGNLNPNVEVVCHKFSTFLIHAGSTALVGDSGSVDDTLDFYRKFNCMMDKFMIDHTNITEEQLKAKRREEWYMTSEDMLEFGIVDRIV